jgi:hypothetical protein
MKGEYSLQLTRLKSANKSLKQVEKVATFYQIWPPSLL